MDVVQPRPCAGPSPTEPLHGVQTLRLKLRELIWRMDQVAEQLRSPARAIDDLTLAQVLDTGDAKSLLTGCADDFR